MFPRLGRNSSSCEILRWSSSLPQNDKSVRCDRVSESVPGANGLAVSEGHLFLGDSKNGTVTVYDIESPRDLRRTHYIDLGAAADNIQVLPRSSDLIVSVFPTLEDLPLYLSRIRSLGKDFKVPASALRLRRSEGYKPEMIYHDDGSVLSFMTASDIDPSNRVLIGAAALQYGGFAVCKLPVKFDTS